MFQGIAATIREQGLWAALKMFVVEYVMSPRKWFSLQGGMVTFIILWIVGITIRQKPWMLVVLLYQRLKSRFDSQQRTARSVIRFYESFISVCDRNGLQFCSHQTARENALQAVQHFSGVLDSPDLRRIPVRIATAFNKVRFGSNAFATGGCRQDSTGPESVCQNSKWLSSIFRRQSF